jgi:hypothetical protein
MVGKYRLLEGENNRKVGLARLVKTERGRISPVTSTTFLGFLAIFTADAVFFDKISRFHTNSLPLPS